MADQNKLKGLKFKISQKNNAADIAVSNSLQAVDIPFCFSRYGYISNDKSGELVNIEDSFFDLKNVTSIPIDRDGFLYLYYEKKAEIDEFDYVYGSEYQINIYLSENRQYNSTSYTKIHPESGNETKQINWKTTLPLPHINFNKGDIVWIAYSEVRWSHEFRERIMNDFESVKKRFQKLDVDSFVDGCKTANPRKNFFLPDHYGTWQKYPKDNKDWNIAYSYYKEQGFNRYIFTIAAATLFVDDMCKLVVQSNADFKDYIDKISSGEDPDTGATCADKDAYQALFMSASILYPILLNMTDKRKNASQDKSPIDKVQMGKLDVLLDLTNRYNKIESIHHLQNETLILMNSNWFKYTLLDYLDNTETNVLKGKIQIKEFYEMLIEDPYMTDINIFSWNAYNLMKKNIGYNPSKDNITAKYSCEHFFYINIDEENKYNNMSVESIKYENIDSTFDIIKLLLNKRLDENKLFEDLPIGIKSIPELYNQVAKIIENFQQEEEDDVVDKLSDAVAQAITLIKFTDSIFWYFTNYVTTTARYKQLDQQLKSIDILIKNLGIEKKEKVGYLADEIEKINKTYEEDIAKQTKRVAKRKSDRDAADRKSKDVKDHKKNKTHSAKWKEEEYRKSTGILNNVELEKNETVNSRTGWRNKDIKKIDKLLIDYEGVEKKNIIMNIDTYRESSFNRVRQIVDSEVWINLTYRFSIAGILSSIYVATNNSNSTIQAVGNSGSVISAITQFVSIAGDKYFSLHQDRWEVWMKRLKFKNEKLSFGLRTGMASVITQAAVDSLFAYQNLAKGSTDAALLYSTSAASAAIVIFCQWSIAMGTATTAMPYIAGAFLIIGTIASVAAPFFENDEFEDFLTSTAFAKGGAMWWSKEINIREFKTSHVMGIELYQNRKDYSAINYTGLGFTNADLSNYSVMFDIIRSLLAPVKVILYGSGERIKGIDFPLIKYSRFRLWVKYDGGIFAKENTEYEARLYPYGTHRNQKIYTTIKLDAEKDLTRDGGKLFRFVVNDRDMPQVRNGETDGRSADLVVLVRIRSLNNAQKNGFYPSKQNGEDVYLGFKVKLISAFDNYYTFSRDLQPLPLSQILAMKG